MPLILLQSELVDSAALMENKALQRLAAIVTMLIAWGVICSPTEMGKKLFSCLSPSVFVAINKGKER